MREDVSYVGDLRKTTIEPLSSHARPVSSLTPVSYARASSYCAFQFVTVPIKRISKVMQGDYQEDEIDHPRFTRFIFCEYALKLLPECIFPQTDMEDRNVDELIREA